MAACQCKEKKKPITSRNWEVVDHESTGGRFLGPPAKPSNYSNMFCHSCRVDWRTRAKYVDLIYRRDEDNETSISINTQGKG